VQITKVDESAVKQDVLQEDVVIAMSIIEMNRWGSTPGFKGGKSRS
jgi:hypothetical protein